MAKPYLVYMPEKNSLLMLVSCDYPQRAMVMSSNDQGALWSAPKDLHLDGQGKPHVDPCTCLAYLGHGKVMVTEVAKSRRWLSDDYGETWHDAFPVPPFLNGETWYQWDPQLVDRDPDTGKVIRILETGFLFDKAAYEQSMPIFTDGYIRFSADECHTWSEAIKIPWWHGVGEVALIRARNSNIVAACRTNMPRKFKGYCGDHNCGLGVSISTDNGYTWSKLNMLYEWGRHHPSMVLLPNGDIVMTYVARLGYADTPEGFPQYGIEAVVSYNHGESWDLDHRYFLATWKGLYKRPSYTCSSQSTSSLLLPDGTILSAFGTGYRVQFGPLGEGDHPRPRDVGLVRWHVNSKGLNSDQTITQSPFDSDLRNQFDLRLLRHEIL